MTARFVSMEDPAAIRAFKAAESAAGQAQMAIAMNDPHGYAMAWERGLALVRDALWLDTNWPDVPLSDFLPERMANLLVSKRSAMFVRDLQGLTFEEFVAWDNAGSYMWMELCLALRDTRELHQKIRKGEGK